MKKKKAEKSMFFVYKADIFRGKSDCSGLPSCPYLKGLALFNVISTGNFTVHVLQHHNIFFNNLDHAAIEHIKLVFSE